jgi:hypothetical protein
MEFFFVTLIRFLNIQPTLAHSVVYKNAIECTSGTNKTSDKIPNKQRNSHDLMKLQQTIKMVWKVLGIKWGKLSGFFPRKIPQ